ncbi:Os12g0171500 [Oryza sativa Japonica Group]|jgi:hypothetical protein|uniref:Os12g0171500 protein n=1 Tax=Oryza sativa subsp. japonica TaxID=39947 RepID=A0A0N7KTN0_ORYSJ|nr:hypothetical protein EE612_058070 [Oryza sativa]BAT16074.1 Os12g0171500 [Oryza sativa Japonica Group]
MWDRFLFSTPLMTRCHVSTLRSNQLATSAKAGSKTTKGVNLYQFLKLGDMLYPVLRLRDVIQPRARVEGGKIDLFQDFYKIY